MTGPDDRARCPSCGSENLTFGYGFAGGGGIGDYSFCVDCDFLIHKHVTVPGQCLQCPREEEPDGQDG